MAGRHDRPILTLQAWYAAPAFVKEMNKILIDFAGGGEDAGGKSSGPAAAVVDEDRVTTATQGADLRAAHSHPVPWR